MGQQVCPPLLAVCKPGCGLWSVGRLSAGDLCGTQWASCPGISWPDQDTRDPWPNWAYCTAAECGLLQDLFTSVTLHSFK